MKNYKTTRFKRRTRITPENLEFIRRVKGKYTLAGMLDKILNQYKDELLSKLCRAQGPMEKVLQRPMRPRVQAKSPAVLPALQKVKL